MKINKFLFAIALCAAMQPNISFCMENPIAEEMVKEQAPESKSYWQLYAPQRLQDLRSYVSQKISSTYDAVSEWSTKKKIFVLTVIIGSLAAIYNREQIMQWVGDILQKNNENLREPLLMQFKEMAVTMTRLLNEETRLTNIKNPTEADKNLLHGIFKQINQLSKQNILIKDQLKNLGMSDTDLYEATLDDIMKTKDELRAKGI